MEGSMNTDSTKKLLQQKIDTETQKRQRLERIRDLEPQLRAALQTVVQPELDARVKVVNEHKGASILIDKYVSTYVEPDEGPTTGICLAIPNINSKDSENRTLPRIAFRIQEDCIVVQTEGLTEPIEVERLSLEEITRSKVAELFDEFLKRRLQMHERGE